MGQALYRKYRSKTLDEVIGQEHVTSTLSNALKNNSISHAYLFTGPRGVGKTSVARILAHEINQLKYDENVTDLDIIEIDAASNRRIDEIRDLRDKVHIAPTSAKYKVYIIDEVHMLTKESFNALLKTLEEPPAHVVFILATTEAHKLPDTIISRTQHFNFKPIDNAINSQHLKKIAAAEGIEIDSEALNLIAKHGSGSFRDSIGLLDQLGTQSRNISEKDVQKALGIAPDELIEEIIKEIDSGNASNLLLLLDQARFSGHNTARLASQISDYIRKRMLEQNIYKQEDFKMLKDLVSVSASYDPETYLEIVLLEALLSNNAQLKLKKDPETAETIEKKEVSETPLEKAEQEIVPNTPETNKDSYPMNDSSISDNPWQLILDSLKSKHNTLYSVARMAKVSIVKDKITLIFNFPFHYKRITESKNKDLLDQAIKDVLGKNAVLECKLESKTKTDEDQSRPDINAISNIFGDVEVLES